MIPIQDLLNRIRWDPAYGAARFTIGYYDRVARCIVTVPLQDVGFQAGNHYSFTATEADGSVHQVPFHRVREVHRDGELIWKRAPAREQDPLAFMPARG